jgi:hypothetical protein
MIKRNDEIEQLINTIVNQRLEIQKHEFEQKLEEQKLEQKLEFEQKLEEQKLEQKLEFEQKLEQKLEFEKKLEQKLEEQQKAIIELASVVNKMSDPRLLYWNEGESSSCGTSLSRDESSEIKKKRKNYRESVPCCFACEKTDDLSVAHIIPSKSDDNFKFFSKENGYSEDIETECEANYLVLCGNKGRKKTCHDAYDHFKISLYQDRVESDDLIIYKWFVCNSEGIDKTFALNIKSIELKSTEIGKKYTRLLSWRTIRSLLNPGSLENSPEIKKFMNYLQLLDENTNADEIKPTK